MSYCEVHDRPAVDPQMRAAGVEIIRSRGRGAHVVVRYRGRQTTVPIHGDRDLGPDFVREICKQLGLDPRSVL